MPGPPAPKVVIPARIIADLFPSRPCPCGLGQRVSGNAGRYEAIADRDGRLLPLGWLKLLWRLRTGRVRRGRVVLMGVRARYQRSPLGLALALALIDAVRGAALRRGMTEVELSWILEDNAGMLRLVRTLGATLHKRYRIYDKSLR